ncbi:hypothetical protein ACFLQI_02785 [Candidatus Undinarchaeota archaeon]
MKIKTFDEMIKLPIDEILREQIDDSELLSLEQFLEYLGLLFKRIYVEMHIGSEKKLKDMDEFTSGILKAQMKKAKLDPEKPTFDKVKDYVAKLIPVVADSHPEYEEKFTARCNKLLRHTYNLISDSNSPTYLLKFVDQEGYELNESARQKIVNQWIAIKPEKRLGFEKDVIAGISIIRQFGKFYFFNVVSSDVYKGNIEYRLMDFAIDYFKKEKIEEIYAYSDDPTLFKLYGFRRLAGFEKLPGPIQNMVKPEKKFYPMYAKLNELHERKERK